MELASLHEKQNEANDKIAFLLEQNSQLMQRIAYLEGKNTETTKLLEQVLAGQREIQQKQQ